MKAALVSLLLLFLACSSAHQKTVPAPQTPEVKPQQVSVPRRPIKLPVRLKSPLKGQRNQVFWRLVDAQEMTLLLEALDRKNTRRSMKLNQETFYHPLPSGEWWIKGFKFQGKTYEAMNTSQRATFRVHKNGYSYAGALLVQCPKVGQEHFEELKLMKFFNRYSFSSNQGLCEMVLGNDYDLIKDAWKSPASMKGSRLLLGL